MNDDICLFSHMKENWVCLSLNVQQDQISYTYDLVVNDYMYIKAIEVFSRLCYLFHVETLTGRKVVLPNLLDFLFGHG